MEKIRRFLRNLFMGPQLMTISIHLPESPSDVQIKRAIAMIGLYVGHDTMMRVASTMVPPGVRAGELPPLPGEAPPAVPVVPTVAVPPPVPPAASSGLEAVAGLTSYTGNNGVTVQLDKAGLPWDARIHAGTKTQTQKGEWKSKKGAGDQLTAQVTAELRAAMAARTYMPAPENGGAPATPPPVATVPPPVTPAITPPAVTPPPVPAPQPAGGGDSITTFPALMQKVAPLLAQKIITNEKLNEIAGQVGGAGVTFPVLASRPDLIVAFDAMLNMQAATPA